MLKYNINARIGIIFASFKIKTRVASLIALMRLKKISISTPSCIWGNDHTVDVMEKTGIEMVLLNFIFVFLMCHLKGG